MGNSSDVQRCRSDARADGERRQAVIDIGSNSVRLVIYDGPRRAPFPICNEKALCGLGRDIEDSGLLNPSAIESALAILARFRCLLNEHGNPPARVVATAAVRDARNGGEFVEAVTRIGFDVAVISGAEEARLSGLGVVSFEPGATGLVGDMGGGSLELIRIDGGSISETASLPIGPFRLMKKSKNEHKLAVREIERAIADVDWLRLYRLPVLYAVGGAWRAIARVNMQLRRHPLSVLHHYEMPARQAIETCELIARQSKSSLEDTPGISFRRVDTMPYAALVLKSVLSMAKAERVVVSAGGVREGVLYDALSSEDRSEDPLIAGARSLANRLSPESAMGEAAFELISPLFAAESPADRRIRRATCLLTDVGAFFHPDLRGEQAFDTALRAPFYGLSHAQRVSIALALYCRHEGVNELGPAPQIVGLLSDHERTRAIEVGLALRFVSAFAPKAPHAVRAAAMKVEGDKLTFTAPRSLQPLMDETPRKRLSALAASLKLTAAERYQD